ncbi:MAG: nucleotidyltransferase domain-containing protein [Actinobacteria bacterium]|nr:nucleotidyltransferase domain-containing protein [Actinomycetota bacterium]MBM3712244.1 nucleotidyltransferase domain-containing protein [Actinomycetota bacterium]
MGIYETIERNKLKKNKKLTKSALKEANRIAKILCNEFGAKEVILYGSILKNKFNSSSDIDLAVKGLGDNYFKAFGYCIRNSEFEIDIKPYEELKDNFKKKVSQIGKIILIKN